MDVLGVACVSTNVNAHILVHLLSLPTNTGKKLPSLEL